MGEITQNSEIHHWKKRGRREEIDGSRIAEVEAELKAEIRHETALIQSIDLKSKRLFRVLREMQEFILEKQSAAYARKREAQEKLSAHRQRAARKGGAK